MTRKEQPNDWVARCYRLVLRLYPKAHRQRFEAEMLRTFKDQHIDLSKQGAELGIMFWFAVISNEVVSASKDRLTDLRTRNLVSSLLLIGAVLLIGSSFVWMSGFILFVKIPAILLLAIGFVVTRSRGVRASLRRLPQRDWWREGLLLGTILGVLWTVLNLARYLSSENSSLREAAKSLDLGILLIGMPVLFGLAGFISGRRSGAISSGTLAGIVASVFGSILLVLSLVIVMVVFWGAVRENALQSAEMIRAWHASGDTTFGHYLWLDNLGGALAATLVSLIFGVLLGTLGGALGSALHRQGNDVGRTIPMAGEGLK